MEFYQISQMIMQTSQRIDKATREIYKMAKEKAHTEFEYRQALAEEITRLKAEGMPVSVLYDIAKGNVADKLLERDLAEGLYKSSIESMRALQAELSGLQSILRYQDEIENKHRGGLNG